MFGFFSFGAESDWANTGPAIIEIEKNPIKNLLKNIEDPIHLITYIN